MINVVFISHETSDDTLLGSSLSLNNLIHSVEKECNIFIITPNRGKAYHFFSDKGYKCISLPFKKDTISTKSKVRNIIIFLPKLIVYFLFNIYSLFKAYFYFRDKKIQIVHSNSSVIDFGYYLSKVLHAKHVWHIREFQNLDFGLKPFLGWDRLKRLIKKSDLSISITPYIAKHYGLDKLPNSIVLGDAVRCKTDATSEWPKKKYFLFCGHVCSAKGADLAVKAFSEFSHSLQANQNEYRLKFCGNCDEEYKSKLMAIDPSINDKIDFLGYQADPKPYFKNSIAFLMCSSNEGLGRVTIEAMFYGCPVIGRDTAGTKTLLAEGKYGFPFDTIEQCSQRMMEVVSNVGKAKNIADAAQKHVLSNYSEEVYGKKILSLYKQICN